MIERERVFRSAAQAAAVASGFGLLFGWLTSNAEVPTIALIQSVGILGFGYAILKGWYN
jgi:hypothetical protein